MNPKFIFPELYQFFGGYFYPGWPADYRWAGEAPNFVAVVRHFRAVNPPATVVRLRGELADLASKGFAEPELARTIAELGSGFDAAAAGLLFSEWLEKIIETIDESPTTARVLPEIRGI